MECFLNKNEIRKYQEKVVDECLKLKKDKDKLKDADHSEKINPIVVALLVDKDRNYVISYRGEMLEGDHAEYNLFTNKLDGTDQSDKILFVSLEPCTHDSRLTTISCSEIVGKARIKKIFIGTFDPDELVRYEGYLYLKDKGADIEMFDEDLAKKLISINEDFFKSKLNGDEFFRRFKIEHENYLDLDAIAYFLSKVKGECPIFEEFDIDNFLKEYRTKHDDSLLEEFYQEAKKSHYIFDTIENSKRKIECEFGFMQAFYKNPNTFYKGSKIVVNDFMEDNVEVAPIVFDNSLFVSAENAYSYVYKKIKGYMLGDTLLKEAFRETFLNAVIHKNYKSYAPISIYLYRNRIEIQNPFITDKLNVDNLNEFTMPSNPVNGCFSEIASQMGLFEGQGHGSNSFKKYLDKINGQLKEEQKSKYYSICDILITVIPVI